MIRQCHVEATHPPRCLVLAESGLTGALFQLLHPGVSFRRRKTVSSQPLRSSSTIDGLQAAGGFPSEALPRMYESGLRSEERRMAQAEWMMEVRHMAKKVACGQLGLPVEYPPGGWTSESEGESVREELGAAGTREPVQFCRRSAGAERLQAAQGLGARRLGSACQDGADPEAAPTREPVVLGLPNRMPQLSAFLCKRGSKRGSPTGWALLLSRVAEEL
ncbi:uncharacterized protein LOC123023558 [Varanus komodoensis]|uniref:uncharacterized protein LOC123023558 n=1 Tax=Varanus komodoensis TaxID=61221 RepID=UPI001CF7DCA2|nr:uncharacterized protein LOC123023558 [Varanus komodoensis]